jgi:hypothetical protein
MKKMSKLRMSKDDEIKNLEELRKQREGTEQIRMNTCRITITGREINIRRATLLMLCFLMRSY